MTLRGTMTDIEEIWQELLDKDDRTSPAEYPEMVLITRDELAQIIEDQHMQVPRSAATTVVPAPEAPTCPSWVQAANAALQAYEADLGEPLDDQHELGRIDDSRGSSSFRIRVGHIRGLLATPSTATSAEPAAHSKYTLVMTKAVIESPLPGLPVLCDGKQVATIWPDEAGLYDHAGTIIDLLNTATPPSSGNADAVREALVKAQEAISKLAFDALGYGEDDAGRWPLRDEFLQAIDTALSSAPVAGEWQDISTAPIDGTEVWVSGPSFNDFSRGRYVSEAIYHDGAWRQNEEDSPLYAPTHWQTKQPAPEPPTDPRNDREGDAS